MCDRDTCCSTSLCSIRSYRKFCSASRDVLYRYLALTRTIRARDRFLAPSGLMVPSQTRLVLTAITGEKLWKERVDFWKSIYGESFTLPD